MRRFVALIVSFGIATAAIALGVVLVGPLWGADDEHASGQERGTQVSAMRSAPTGFIENKGQADGRVSYYLEGRRGAAYFTKRGMRVALADRDDPERQWNLKLDYVGARQPLRPIGRNPTGTTVGYFQGAPKDWKTNVRTYSKLVYRDVWPGIDAVYSAGPRGALKYSFVVKPGSDPDAIRMAWRGASGVDVTKGGQLRVSTPGARLHDSAPVSYQVVDGRRVRVRSRFALAGETVGFRVGRYDPNRSLVIDPAVLVYAGYIGGINHDQANNVAVDRRGNLYVAGTTQSRAGSFPAKVGPDRSFNGAPDAFVAKVKPGGRRLAYAGYIGGSDEEAGIGIAVDGNGAAYVTGSTASDESTFPVRRGPDLTYGGGPFDAFIAKVHRSGKRLVYAGYIGGSGITPPGAPNEQGNGVAVDASGNAYVAGFTASSENAGFPVTPGSLDDTFNGIIDTFVVKVNPSGRGFVYGGYIGGSGPDPGTGLSIDRQGAAYVTGFTASDEETFPNGDGFGSIPGFDRTYNGGTNPFPLPNDAYVAKVSPEGDRLEYASYIGGAGVDQPFNNQVDGRGNVYVTGNTTSTEETFPNGEGFGAIKWSRRPGFDQTYNGGTDPTGGDAFVVSLDRTGTRARYATYIGGPGEDRAIGIALDGRRAFIAGETNSPLRSFPTTRGVARAGLSRRYNGGPSDAFVTGLDVTGTQLRLSGYLGGRGDDRGIGLAVDRRGDVYTAGLTTSRRKTFPVRRGPSLRFKGPAGIPNAFVAKIAMSRR